MYNIKADRSPERRIPGATTLYGGNIECRVGEGLGPSVGEGRNPGTSTRPHLWGPRSFPRLSPSLWTHARGGGEGGVGPSEVIGAGGRGSNVLIEEPN